MADNAGAGRAAPVTADEVWTAAQQLSRDGFARFWARTTGAELARWKDRAERAEKRTGDRYR